MSDDLIETIGRAKGPSRALDERIALSVGWTRRQVGQVEAWFDPNGRMHGAPPRFTESLDAAATLIAEGKYWYLGAGKTEPDEPLYGAVIAEPIIEYKSELGAGETNAGAAIALTLAALRARARVQ